MESCVYLRELDEWFSLALDVLAGVPGVRRDVMVLLGGAGTAAEVVTVTRGDVEEVGGHLFVYPRSSDGHCLPLTAGFAEVTALRAAAWPAVRIDEAADEAAVLDAVEAVDAALARLTGSDRPGGVDRLRALRMHAWQHELGSHLGILARCYGGDLPALVAASGTCPATRREQEVALLVPSQHSRALRPAVA